MPNPKRQLSRRAYPLRALGMGLGGVVVGVVLWERNAGLAAWLCMAAISFVWPHVAHLLSRRSADPYRAEIRNLLVDSALAVVLVTLMHFNLLPSVLLVTLTMVDKITTGIRGLWARSLPGMAGAAVAGAAFNGFQRLSVGARNIHAGDSGVPARDGAAHPVGQLGELPPDPQGVTPKPAARRIAAHRRPHGPV